MMTFPLSLRRQVILRALRDDSFRAALLSDPKAAIHDETGVALPNTVTVGVLEEAEKVWAFVAPAEPLAAEDLPDPAGQVRFVLENLILAALARDPGLWGRAQSDPYRLLLAIDADVPPDVIFYIFPSDTVLMRQETDSAIWLVIPYRDRNFHFANDDELPDEWLDYVSAGGRSPCNTDDTRYGDAEGTNDQTRGPS